MPKFLADPADKKGTPVLDSNDIIDEELGMSITDFDWTEYFNADLFEPYSPSKPFFLHDSVVEDNS